MKNFKIKDQIIGENHAPYIIAELSGNHNGDINKALRLMEIAKISGADAIKIQTYTADTITIDCEKEDFKITDGLWAGKTLYQLYDWAHTPWEWHKRLFDKANELNITLFSSPFDETAVDFLEALDCPAYKIASFECLDFPLIKKAASTGKPLIISTGMANLEELDELTDYLKELEVKNYALLHCISGYPTPPEQSNLLTISDMLCRFQSVVGLSDHTLENAVSISGVALGASIIEKHLTLSRQVAGPDSAFSIEPSELVELCRQTKIAWAAMGSVNYTLKEAEKQNVQFRRSIYFVKDLKKGEEIAEQHIKRIRPGHGLAPKYFDQLLGKRVGENVSRGTAVRWELIDDE